MAHARVLTSVFHVGEAVEVHKPGFEEDGVSGVVVNVAIGVNGLADWRREHCVDVALRKTWQGGAYADLCAFSPSQLRTLSSPAPEDA